MNLNTVDVLKKKILDSQEMVRDYEKHSKKIRDTEVALAFKEFAEESGMQATKLQDLLKKHESQGSK
ncbi:hypothetical protein Curi_c09780 [Gottschalkia acidurici 9a]|uniref:Uncharacterized protein n=1 Tax=Gottschalkia acidurici (strain ATCC 7906 / DSM 604 / BCRC 14475 / CIP 104303 / KCTC 5404 / NCIMB 10678 / 9a) TaxID=1128398 RepID=K0AXT4_GOTA9|nr:hypothetical protein [Gottschalkia acidurici]AFS77994.1 hypothetical protein Curi_c09780 [Gottschalkia acidurici 9a]